MADKLDNQYMKLEIIIFLLFLVVEVDGQQVDTSEIRKDKGLIEFSYFRPVFKLNNEQSKNTYRHLRFSVVTGYREGVEPISGFGSFSNFVDTISGTARAYMINLSIQDLLSLGFNFPNNLTKTQGVIKDLFWFDLLKTERIYFGKRKPHL